MSTLDTSVRPARSGPALVLQEQVSAVDEAVDRGRRYLLDIQREDGHWRAELEGDSILESEYILTMFALGRGAEAKVAKAGEALRRGQSSAGGWSPFPGAENDVNPTVKAYFALKLLGDAADLPHMEAARKAAVALGGLGACNSFTKIYLAIFGQFPWSRCPAVPPELVLLPSWVPFNIYEMSAWSRTIVVPLSILRALRPLHSVPASAAIGELDVPSRPAVRKPSRRAAGWTRFFRLVDGLLRFYERAPLPGLRRRALAEARRWTVDRLEQSDGLGAIFPPIVNSIFALRALGHEGDEELIDRQVAQLERLEIEEEETLRVEPCFSPVWDTALSLATLLDTGTAPDARAITRGAAWLLGREVRSAGDWQRKCPQAPVGGWYFEYANEFYPDCDDTAQVVSSLSRVEPATARERERLDRAVARGVAWLEHMQNRDGGWGAFDKDCDREFLTYIPFADHNAMIDPATVDVTARVIEALLRSGRPAASPAVRAAVAFLRRSQEIDGSWFGRWGCNYLYGTHLALGALRRAGESRETSTMRRAVEWLEVHQNEDGGWGELPTSYTHPETRGCGPSTACQTGWGLLGLMAAGEAAGSAARRGIDYLLAGQERDGGWTDAHWTGTGFPEVFYLRYHLYATYFPLMALSTHRRLERGEDVFSTRPVLAPVGNPAEA